MKHIVVIAAAYKLPDQEKIHIKTDVVLILEQTDIGLAVAEIKASLPEKAVMLEGQFRLFRLK